MGETLDPEGRRAGGPSPGIARLATLATGASALVVAGWCGAFVNRALDAGTSAPAVPSVVLPPLGSGSVAVSAPAAPPPASSQAAAAAPVAGVTGVAHSAVFTAAIAAPRRDVGVTHVPLPVRAARIASAGPAGTPNPPAEAPRVATGTPLTAPSSPAPAPDGGSSSDSGGAQPAPVLRVDADNRRSFAAGAAQARAAGPGRPAGSHHAGDGDVDRG